MLKLFFCYTFRIIKVNLIKILLVRFTKWKKNVFWTFAKAYSDFPFLVSGLPSIEIRATLLLIEANENDTCHFYI
jgi:hypothetical protein